jgi:hypothetical protein
MSQHNKPQENQTRENNLTVVSSFLFSPIQLLISCHALSVSLCVCYESEYYHTKSLDRLYLLCAFSHSIVVAPMSSKACEECRRKIKTRESPSRSYCPNSNITVQHCTRHTYLNSLYTSHSAAAALTVEFITRPS